MAFREHILCFAYLVVLCTAQPTSGPYDTASTDFEVAAFDSSDQNLWVIYPSNATAGTKFPLISYAHGMAGGGQLDILGYTALFNQLASYGFIVAAPKSCNEGW
jgi:predicted dienelactone hydrolase